MSKKLSLVLFAFSILSPLCLADIDTFIPPKYKGIVVYAPTPIYPEAARSHYTLGAQGVYRLTVNPQNGGVDEVGVLKRAGHSKLDSVMVMAFFKWRFKPGSFKQIDIPVMFEREIRVELKGAATR